MSEKWTSPERQVMIYIEMSAAGIPLSVTFVYECVTSYTISAAFLITSAMSINCIFLFQIIHHIKK